MNNISFLSDIHQYIEDEYKGFELYQAVSKEILCEMDRVCRTNNIPFFLTFGSLLGMVRDGGQMPWDYDIDVMMPITYKNAFINALGRLSSDYYYCYTNNVKKYPTTCLRLCKKGYSFLAIHVDVFFLIGAPNNDNMQNLFFKKVRRIVSRRDSKYARYYFKTKQDKLSKFVGFLRSIKYFFISEHHLKRMEDRICSRYPLELAEKWIVFCADNILYPKAIFSGTVSLGYDGLLMPAPSGYVDFLTLKYNDYLQYPKLKQRFEEFYRMKSLLDERQNNS